MIRILIPPVTLIACSPCSLSPQTKGSTVHLSLDITELDMQMRIVKSVEIYLVSIPVQAYIVLNQFLECWEICQEYWWCPVLENRCKYLGICKHWYGRAEYNQSLPQSSSRQTDSPCTTSKFCGIKGLFSGPHRVRGLQSLGQLTCRILDDRIRISNVLSESSIGVIGKLSLGQPHDVYL